MKPFPLGRDDMLNHCFTLFALSEDMKPHITIIFALWFKAVAEDAGGGMATQRIRTLR